MTYSKMLADGTFTRPSYLVNEVKKYFSNLHTKAVTNSLLAQESTPESGIRTLVQGLQKRTEGLAGGWKELYTWYKKHPEWSEKLEQILEATFYQKPEGVLSRETAKLLYGDVLENSVTRLEKYSACAYAHFLSYGLNLQERELYQGHGTF